MAYYTVLYRTVLNLRNYHYYNYGPIVKIQRKLFKLFLCIQQHDVINRMYDFVYVYLLFSKIYIKIEALSTPRRFAQTSLLLSHTKHALSFPLAVSPYLQISDNRILIQFNVRWKANKLFVTLPLQLKQHCGNDREKIGLIFSALSFTCNFFSYRSKLQNSHLFFTILMLTL